MSIVLIASLLFILGVTLLQERRNTPTVRPERHNRPIGSSGKGGESRNETARSAIVEGGKPLPPPPSEPWFALSQWFRSRRNRVAAHREFWLARRDDSLLVQFHCLRTPTQLDFTIPPGEEMSIRAVWASSGEQTISLAATVESNTLPDDAGTLIRLRFESPVATRNLEIIQANFTPCHVVAMVHGEDDDLSRLAEITDSVEQGDHGKARGLLEKYEHLHSTSCPAAALLRARIERETERPREAAYHALRSFMMLREQPAWGLYQDLQEELEAIDVPAIRELQGSASAWMPETERGVIELDRQQEVWLCADGWHLTITRHRMEVRREAAGRLMRTLSFPIAMNRETVVRTSLRVVHGDDTVAVVPDENYTISDSEEQNTLITVDDDKAGTWILPDLHRGDVIEWTFHVVRSDHEFREPRELFVTLHLFSSFSPTHRAVTRFFTPPGMQCPRFATRNTSLKPQQTDGEDGWVVTTFSGKQYLPSNGAPFRYERGYLDPLIACSHVEDTWKSVAERSQLVNFGSRDYKEALPPALQSVLQDAPDPDGALESAYYWVRDKLKYASLASTGQQVGMADRARRILESGTGDCKDKTYLLALAARDLGLPCEFVAVSSDRGMVMEELPSQQFDHVFLRVRMGDTWRYLDAADSLGIYGSPPIQFQGIQAMVGDESGTIVTLPEDDPSRNHIRYRETFHEVRDGWLQGSFDLEAFGHYGRLANERFKSGSMERGDVHLGAQRILGYYLPYLLLHGHERVSDTGNSNLFHLSGQHARCQLVALGSEGLRVGRLHWNAELIPWDWRNCNFERVHVLDCPCRLDMEIRVEGDAFRSLRDVSRIRTIDNGFCGVSEEIIRETDALVVRRSVEYRRRFIRDEQITHLPGTFEAVEEACLMVLSFG